MDELDEERARRLSFAFTMLGDRVTVRLVGMVGFGTQRFSDFKERFDVSDAVLSSRVHDMIELGVIDTERYSDHPPRFQYIATQMGHEFWPIALGTWWWDMRWSPHTRSGSMELEHRTCGARSRPWFGCGRCHQQLPSDETLRAPELGALLDTASFDRTRYRRGKPRVGDEHMVDIFDVLADRWSILLILTAVRGSERFSEFQSLLGVSSALLTSRLKELVQHGVFDRSRADSGNAVRYRLTEKGHELRPLLIHAWTWMLRWTPGSDSLQLVHRTCDKPIDAAWFCSGCDGVLRPHDMVFHFADGVTPPLGIEPE